MYLYCAISTWYFAEQNKSDRSLTPRGFPFKMGSGWGKLQGQAENAKGREERTWADIL